MTPLHTKLKKLREVCERATSGKPKVVWNEKVNRWEVYGGLTGIEGIARFFHNEDRPDTKIKAEYDAKLYAQARTMLPRLIESIEETVEIFKQISEVKVMGVETHEAVLAKHAIEQITEILEGE